MKWHAVIYDLAKARLDRSGPRYQFLRLTRPLDSKELVRSDIVEMFRSMGVPVMELK